MNLHPALKSVIVKAIEKHRTLKAASRDIGVSNVTLSRWCAELGIDWRAMKLKWRLEAIGRGEVVRNAWRGPETEERMRAMAKLRSEGASLSDIGHVYGVTLERVRQILFEAKVLGIWDGVVGRKVTMAESMAESMAPRAKELWDMGMKVADIAAKFGCGVGTVRAALVVAGMTRKDISMRGHEILKKYSDEEIRAAWEIERSVTGVARRVTGKAFPRNVGTFERRLWQMGLVKPRKRARVADDADVAEAMRATGGNVAEAAKVVGYSEGSLRGRLYRMNGDGAGR